MLFNSLVFLLFISIVLLIYPRLRLRQQNLFLLFANYFFYGWWDWRFNILLFASTLVDFTTGQKIYASDNDKHKRGWLLVSIAFNLGLLCSFKYFNFFIDSAAALAHSFGFDPHLPVLRIILPVGLSFYSFQSMSYIIDIYRGRLAPERNFIDYAVFVSFFPQLVAGPIERGAHLLPQIRSARVITKEKVMTGLNLVLLGFFKKVAIADTLAPIVENIFSRPESMTSGQLLTGVYAFTFQIYGDFSGYTDIARGIALILGFELIENFNAPYLSRNITEFWRRWHISLSTWLRDYLYVSLGGNRRGRARTYANLIITMFLGGLWHGAAWHFAIWGVMHGIYLAGHRMILGGRKESVSRPETLAERAADIVKIIFTFHVVALTWILFRTESIGNAIVYLERLFLFQNMADLQLSVMFAACLLLALDGVQAWSGSHTWLTDGNRVRFARYAVAQMMFVSTVTAAITHFHKVTPFIYFQF
jgi:alginate O-acetyltransferase complex protein AlgI